MTNYFLLALIISLPFQFALNIGENFDLVTTRLLIPLLFAAWLARGLFRKKIWIPNKSESWLLLCFVFLSMLSLFLGRDAGVGIRKALYLLTIVPVFFVAADIFRREKWKKRGAMAIAASGSLAAVIALIQFFLPFLFGIEKSVSLWKKIAPYFLGNSLGELVASNSSWLVNIGGETWMRAFGFFPDPHNFSFFVNICFFFGLGFFFAPARLAIRNVAGRQKKETFRVWIGAGTLLMLLAAGLSFSRGAYLGLFAGLVFFGAVFLKRAGLAKRTWLVIGLGLIMVLVFSSGAISQRLASSFNWKEGSNVERYKNWTQAVDLVREHPFSGVGLGNYARAVDSSAAERSSIYAHNIYLDIAAETGILNAVIFLFLILASVLRNVKNGSSLNLGIAAGLVGFSVHSFFDTPLYSPQVLTILLVIIAYSVSTIFPRREKPSEPISNDGIVSSLCSKQ